MKTSKVIVFSNSEQPVKSFKEFSNEYYSMYKYEMGVGNEGMRMGYKFGHVYFDNHPYYNYSHTVKL